MTTGAPVTTQRDLAALIAGGSLDVGFEAPSNVIQERFEDTDPRLSGPGYVTPKEQLAWLCDRRAEQRLVNELYHGKWDIILERLMSQHWFRKARRHGGQVKELIVKINVVKDAILMMADFIANNAPTFNVSDEFGAQRDAIATIKRAVLMQAQFHEIATTVGIDGAVMVRTSIDPISGGAVLCIEDAETCFAVGRPGPDGQPTVFERRWIIERESTGSSGGREKIRFLRVERFRMRSINGRRMSAVENEAYSTSSSDVLVDLNDDEKKVKRVPLHVALAMDVGSERIPFDLTLIDVPYPLITQFVTYRIKGRPQMRLTKNDVDMIDGMMAAMSRLDRTHEHHAPPQMKGPDSHIDPATGTVDANQEYVVDPDANYGQAAKQIPWADMLAFLSWYINVIINRLECAPSLAGYKSSAGTTADTAEKFRLEATRMLAAANRARPFLESSLERAMETACWVQSVVVPMQGFAVGPVKCDIHPELPKTGEEVVAEETQKLSAGLTSRRRAVARIHGDQEADAVMEEIKSDNAERAASAQASFSGLFGQPVGAGGGA